MPWKTNKRLISQGFPDLPESKLIVTQTSIMFQDASRVFFMPSSLPAIAPRRRVPSW